MLISGYNDSVDFNLQSVDLYRYLRNEFKNELKDSGQIFWDISNNYYNCGYPWLKQDTWISVRLIFTSGLGDQGLIQGRVIPKAQNNGT